MYACNFNTNSFLSATLFIECLVQNNDNVFNLIDTCKNDPTLTLDLHLISETTRRQARV